MLRRSGSRAIRNSESRASRNHSLPRNSMLKTALNSTWQSFMEADPSLSDFEKCVTVVCQGYLCLHRGEFDAAQKAFGVGMMLARSLPPEDAADIIPLVLYNVSLLRLRQG